MEHPPHSTADTDADFIWIITACHCAHGNRLPGCNQGELIGAGEVFQFMAGKLLMGTIIFYLGTDLRRKRGYIEQVKLTYPAFTLQDGRLKGGDICCGTVDYPQTGYDYLSAAHTIPPSTTRHCPVM
jgi:hypothetical protein